MAWEYCRYVYGEDSVSVMRLSGIQNVKHAGIPEGPDRGAAIIARLGRDDWELVTVDGTTWLFKRGKNLADAGEW